MQRKRISVIVALAVISTVSPLTYQYLIQPRIEASQVTISMLDLSFNEKESSNEFAAFDVYLKLENTKDTEVILSPLQLDVYYNDDEEERFRLIRDFTTSQDFIIPAGNSTSPGYISSHLDDQGDVIREDSEEYPKNPGQTILGLLKIYKTSGFYEGSNKAMVELINSRSINLNLKGSANFGPVAIPFQTKVVKLALSIWDPEIIIRDIFLWRENEIYQDVFTLITRMRNPSGIPITIDYFDLDLYNTSEDPVDEGDQVGWGIDSRLIARSSDPDNSTQEVRDVFMEGKSEVSFSPSKWTWRNVAYAFNLTNPESPGYQGNIQWFINKLMDTGVIQDITLKGRANIWLGQRGKGFNVSMEDDDELMTLKDVKFYQQYIPKYGDLGLDWTGEPPITMYGKFNVSQLSVNKMIIDTENEQMTLDIDCNLTIENPYRFEYQVSDFQALYESALIGAPFAWSATNTTTNIAAAQRKKVNNVSTSDIEPKRADIPINLTTTYDTGDPNEGIYQMFRELGADT